MKKSILEKLERLSERLAEIDGLLGGEHAARDMDSYRKLTRERADITPVVELFHAYRGASADFSSAAEMLGDPEMKELALAEQESASAEMARLEVELQRALLPTDPNDDRNLFLEIRAGTGGDESALFAADLFRMYSRYAERQRWKVEIVSRSESDLGGVRLNVTSSEAVADAYDLMMLRIAQRAPEAWIEGIYVEKMLSRGLEVIIGMSRDPQFGPMLMFGLGGIFVEVMKDVTFYLAPITNDEAVQMLMSTRSYEILKGKRGHKGVDLAGIANGLQRISQLTTDFPQIAELDINPFIVGEMGTEPVVADARMTLQLTGVGR